MHRAANKIIAAKQKDPNAGTSILENRIDLLVYKPYGLTRAEVKIVDPAFAMSAAADESLRFGFCGKGTAMTET